MRSPETQKPNRNAPKAHGFKLQASEVAYNLGGEILQGGAGGGGGGGGGAEGVSKPQAPKPPNPKPPTLNPYKPETPKPLNPWHPVCEGHCCCGAGDEFTGSAVLNGCSGLRQSLDAVDFGMLPPLY